MFSNKDIKAKRWNTSACAQRDAIHFQYQAIGKEISCKFINLSFLLLLQMNFEHYKQRVK